MHQTVLLQEAVDALCLKASGIYIDGTFGRGGHSRKILEGLDEHARLFVFDKDADAIEVAQALSENDKRVNVVHASFTQIKAVMASQGLLEEVDGVLLDLGLSSPQLDESERGFSFMRNGPLDMRMNKQAGKSAAEWVKEVDEAELAQVIKEFGEERFAKKIARRIVEERQQQDITDTSTLADIVSQAIPKWEKHKHPATRSFQAIRIYINRELEDLSELLEQILQVLKQGGRLVVISFHSLEDRIVKQWMKTMEKGDDLPSYIPVKHTELNKKVRIIGKAIKPGHQEIQQNPRARSAIMRVAEKL